MTPTTRVEFAILGAGAIGSVLGAHLARAGHRVAMLAREPRASLIEREGLRLRGLVEFSTPVTVLREPARLAGAEVLIVAMKTPGTAAALAPLRVARPDAAFSIQNGLAKNAQLAAAFGAQCVLGALADLSGELCAGGEVLFTRNVRLYLGELAPGGRDRAGRIAGVLEAAGIRASATAHIESLEWSKFCAWVGLAGVSIATRAHTWRYLSDPDTAWIVLQLVREAGLLARATGVALTDESVLPAALLCERPEDEALAALLAAGERFRVNAPEHRMSCLQDLEAGRALEVEETFGEAHRRALRLGLRLPLIEAFYRLLAGLNRRRA